jgi:site-specific recombinase XerD
MADVPATFRPQLLALLGPDANPAQPDAQDRFKAWCYGAAPNSRRAAAADLCAWRAFCTARAARPVPASPLDVRDFARAQHQAGLKASSISRQLASIALLHDLHGYLPSPTRDRVVTCEMKGIRRDQGLAGRGSPRQARPLRLKGDVADIFADAPQPLSILALLQTLPPGPTGLRDAVLLRLGADLGRRRSEYVALDVGDMSPAADGSGTVTIRRSKTDQAGEGRVKWLSPEAMQAIAAWLAHRLEALGAPLPAEAPLLTSVDRFGRIGGRLSADGLRDVLRRIARRSLEARYPDWDEAMVAAQLAGLSGHSFRVGFAQDLVAAGADVAAICQAADWRSPDMPVRYAQGLAARSGAVARFRGRLAG